MAKSKILRAEIKYLLWTEVYYRLEKPGSKRRALEIVETAIHCLSKKGFDNVTYEMIAREAAVSRTLLNYYFEDLDEISTFAIKYIRLMFQKLVVDSFSGSDDATKMLECYLKTCLLWVVSYKKYALVWLAFLHRCGHDAKLRAMNTEATAVGNDRISQIIERGVRQGAFKCTDPQSTASAIQHLISGSLISFVSENNQTADDARRILLESAFCLLGSQPEV